MFISLFALLCVWTFFHMPHSLHTHKHKNVFGPAHINSSELAKIKRKKNMKLYDNAARNKGNNF